jgi:hypothetical protein
MISNHIIHTLFSMSVHTPSVKHVQFVKQLFTSSELIDGMDAVEDVRREMGTLMEMLPTHGSGYSSLKLYKKLHEACKVWDQLHDLLEDVNSDVTDLLMKEKKRGAGSFDVTQEEINDKQEEEADRNEILRQRGEEACMLQNPDPYSMGRDADLDLKAEFMLKKRGFSVEEDGVLTGQFLENNHNIKLMYDEEGISVVYDGKGTLTDSMVDFATEHNLPVRSLLYYKNKEHERISRE